MSAEPYDAYDEGCGHIRCVACDETLCTDADVMWTLAQPELPYCAERLRCRLAAEEIAGDDL